MNISLRRWFFICLLWSGTRIQRIEMMGQHNTKRRQRHGKRKPTVMTGERRWFYRYEFNPGVESAKTQRTQKMEMCEQRKREKKIYIIYKCKFPSFFFLRRGFSERNELAKALSCRWLSVLRGVGPVTERTNKERRWEMRKKLVSMLIVIPILILLRTKMFNEQY